MPIPVATQRVPRVLQASQFYDGIIAVFAAIAGFVASSKFFVEGWYWSGWFAAIAAAGVFFTSVIRAVVTYRTQQQRETVHELEGCLMTLYAVLVDTDSPDEEREAGLRLTVHVPTADGRELQQVLTYVGDQRGGPTAGRRFPIQIGIAGYVFRTREPYYAWRESGDYEDYVRELIEHWAFSEADARQVDPASMSWMAVPLANGAIEGILYLDSRDPDFFDEDRQDVVLRGAIGVARFVAQRYAGSQEVVRG